MLPPTGWINVPLAKPRIREVVPWLRTSHTDLWLLHHGFGWMNHGVSPHKTGTCHHFLRDAQLHSQELPSSCTLRDPEMGGAVDFVRTHLIQRLGVDVSSHSYGELRCGDAPRSLAKAGHSDQSSVSRLKSCDVFSQKQCSRCECS